MLNVEVFVIEWFKMAIKKKKSKLSLIFILIMNQICLNFQKNVDPNSFYLPVQHVIVYFASMTTIDTFTSA